MQKKIKNIYILVALAIVVIFLFQGGSTMSAVSPSDDMSSTGEVHILIPKGSLQSIFGTGLQSFVTGYDSFVDDMRVVGCDYTDESMCDTDKYSKCVVVRYFSDLGWNNYNSCRGWMADWGCTKWALQNGGQCLGESSDSTVECKYNRDCDSDEFCNGFGQCKTAEDTCANAIYCSAGSLYRCELSKMTLMGHCYDQYKSTNECAKTWGSKLDTMCKPECSRDSDCDSEELCTPYGRCTVEEGVPGSFKDDCRIKGCDTGDVCLYVGDDYFCVEEDVAQNNPTELIPGTGIIVAGSTVWLWFGFLGIVVIGGAVILLRRKKKNG